MLVLQATTLTIEDAPLSQPALVLSKTANMSLEIRIVSANALSDVTIARWNEIRRSSDSYRSPFFAPRFTQLVASIKPDVQVAEFWRGEDLVGILPFELNARGQAIPVAGAFNDAHGIICQLNSINYSDFFKNSDLRSYRFHALAGDAEGFEPYVFGTTASYLADLERHEQGYVSFLEKERATIFKQRRKTKKMIKDLGPLRLEFDCRDESVMQQAIALKRDQYQRTNIFDILSVDWAREMLYRFWQDTQHECRGLLTALYAGDHVVAIHYGLLEGNWLHYWFPVFDPKYHQYSPGTALFLEIARKNKELGLSKIDMGYGEQSYKLKLTDTISYMPHGFIDNSPIRWWTERCRYMSMMQLKQIPFKETAKMCIRKVWPNFGASRYQ